MNISETIRVAQKDWESFVDFVICHRMVSLREFALRDLDLKKGDNFKFVYLRNGNGKAQNVWKTFVDYDICHRMM